MLQVLRRTRSASSRVAAARYEAEDRSESILAESTAFIWHPNVFMKTNRPMRAQYNIQPDGSTRRSGARNGRARRSRRRRGSPGGTDGSRHLLSPDDEPDGVDLLTQHAELVVRRRRNLADLRRKQGAERHILDDLFDRKSPEDRQEGHLPGLLVEPEQRLRGDHAMGARTAGQPRLLSGPRTVEVPGGSEEVDLRDEPAPLVLDDDDRLPAMRGHLVPSPAPGEPALRLRERSAEGGRVDVSVRVDLQGPQHPVIHVAGGGVREGPVHIEPLQRPVRVLRPTHRSADEGQDGLRPDRPELEQLGHVGNV